MMLFEENLLYSLVTTHSDENQISALIRNHFFVIMLTLYLNQLHQIIGASCHRFCRMQSAIAKQIVFIFELEQSQYSQIETQNKRIVYCLARNRNGTIYKSVHRQASKLKIFEGEYFGEGFDYRHLHVAA